jgi:preprotein translocase subunit SecF
VGVLAVGAGGVLAVLGYSVNESVVIFDRIREAFRKFRKLSTTR